MTSAIEVWLEAFSQTRADRGTAKEVEDFTIKRTTYDVRQSNYLLLGPIRSAVYQSLRNPPR